MRKFYLTYRTRKPIPQTASAELAFELTQAKESSSHSPPMFMLSWSHYVFLIAIKDDSERNFYEVEATQQQWALRELKRQFDSSLFERLALSRSKGEVRRLADEGQILSKPRDLLRDPYVLEFLALEERSKYSESDLETAIIDKLPHDANIFAAQYQLYLPSKEELKQKLMDWTAAQAED